MRCKICKLKISQIFVAKVLKKYNVRYFHCNNCGFLQTEKPFWLDEAYKTTINISDTGILARNIKLAMITSAFLYGLFDKKKNFLDYGGGYGVFTRLMRDIGFKFFHVDPYCTNIFAKRFEYDNKTDVELVTVLEAFEHFVDPLTEIANISKISNNILFSTQVLPQKIPKPADWWYYGFEHGQHIAFYQKKTLAYLASHFKLNLYSDNKYIHLLTTKRINPTIFSLAVKFYLPLFSFVIWRMKSLTFNDHLSLK